MGWMQKLAETYDNCSSQIGEVYIDENGVKSMPLLPIAHTTRLAQIEITIDSNGNFKRAELVSSKDASTIIPCSEDSDGRTGKKPKPHPLCDGLQYIAGDYQKYGGTKTFLHDLYVSQLRAWCDSGYSHPKAQAVLKYVSKGQVIRDLVEANVLLVDDNDQLLDKWNKNINRNAPNVRQDASMVRFIVWEEGNTQASVWDDKSLHDSWISYYASIKGQEDVCYITGEIKTSAKQHAKYIRTGGDGAKLISSNDDKGFTFRGRFRTANGACVISYEVSQKAHYALKWLISRQGRVFIEKNGPGLTVVAWDTSGAYVPNPTDDTSDVAGLDVLPDYDNVQVYTAQDDALKLNKKIAGYKASLEDMADVVVIALNSATTGRMAISFYRELKGSDFAERLERWHNTCCWDQQYWDSERFKKFIGAPAPRIIAESAYGRKVDEKLLKKTVERLLPCIVDGHKIPRDLMESAVRRACNRVGAKSEGEWETVLGVACALYRKYQIDYKGEDVGMGLDHDRLTRDYLYGRLLAIADVFEQRALSKAERNRPTNAAKYMQRFAERPASTWRYIELALEPYMARLSPGTNYYYKKHLDEVMDKFDVKDFIDDKKLSGEFLLGYHCQRKELIPSTKNDKTPINMEEMEVK
ncbi:MAG: type I-C CRISPR-associated protein Cas8c/Csd1 [Peptococcaceae bacterium]|nr:type I-C CRISPR-associated protein Cas8c/Csd1 [Peptococcaceae bacterium]